MYGDKYPSLPVPVRENYDFMGWYTDLTGGSRITTSTDVTEAEPHTLYARWRGQRVTVSFDGNGYTGTINSKRVRYKENYGDLPAPERAGYKFEGWFTTADGTDEITKDSTVENSENHTLYAHWSGLKYTLEFDANGGTCDTRYIEVTFGSTYRELPEPEWEGHEFAGWYTASSGGKKITADTTVSADNFNPSATSHIVYAQWTGKRIKVTLDANGGTCDKDEVTAVVGAKYPTLPTPKKDKYEFAGWYTSLTGGSEVTASTEVTETEPHTLYARWAGKKVTVSFDGNGYTRTINPITPRYNETYGDLPEPVRPGYELIGWFTSADGADEITADSVVENSNDHTLYAHWSGLKYTLEFDPNGGTCGTDDKEVTFGSAYGELPDASRDGYDFAGWYTAASGGKKIEAQMFVSTQNFNLQASVHKIYAHWTGKQYTITLDANGGTVQPGTTTVTFGSTYGELPRPSRSGFTFSGWFTEATGGTQVKADTFVSADNLDITSDTHKLYAHWKGKKVRVRFSAGNLGNVKGNFYQKDVYAGEPYGELPEVEPFANYEFTGWFTKETGGDRVTPDTAVTASENHTLYAQYKGKDIAVTFDVNGGRALPDDQKARTVNYDSPYGELPVPERDGHDFLGWYYSLDASDPAIVTDATNVDNAEAHTLYARWRIKRFTVTFDANGGYWEDDGNNTKTVTKEWNSVISEKDLSSSGNPISSVQKFDGWYKDKTGVDALSEEDRVTDDMTVYAGWSAVEQGFFISGLKNSYTYTGEQIRPDITVYDTAVTPDRPLRENVDYTLSYANNVNAGKADDPVMKKRPAVTIKGKGNYQKSQTLYFTIVPARFDTGDNRTFSKGFAVTVADKKYSGSKQISKPAIKLGKKTLSEGRDYTVSYEGDTLVGGNPVNPGKVTVKVTAKDGGNFTGSAETGYYIYEKQKNIGDAYTVPIPDQVYTGRGMTVDDIIPYVTVKENKNSGALARGGESDAAGEYYVRFADGADTENVGTVSLEIIGKGRYANSRKTVRFKIVAADIRGCSILPKDTVYDGTAKQPKVTVTRGTGTDAAILEEGRDYTVSYSNNINAAGAGSGNKAPMAIIKGKGNYAGSSATVPFTIKPLALSASDLEISVPNQKAANGKTYDAKSIGGELKYYNPVLGKSIKLVYGKDYDTVFDYDARSRVQTASFVLKSNYENDMQINGGKIEKQFIIGAFLPSLFYAADYDIVADDEGLTYTGAAIKPKITVVLKTSGTRIVLTEGKDYKVSYSNNTNACDKNASDKAPSWKITGAGIFTGTVERKFTIHKRSLNDGFELSAADVKCTGKAQKPSVKVIDKTTGKVLKASEYTLAYTDTSRVTDEAVLTATGNGERGTGNYCGKLSVSFRVYEKAISSAYFEGIADRPYTGKRIIPDDALIKGYSSRGGTELIKGRDYELEYGPNTALGTGTVTVTGKGDYGGTAVLKFKIVPKQLAELRNKQE